MLIADVIHAGDLLLWYNAVFVGVFAIGAFFTLLQVLGMGGDADVDASAAPDTDVDVNVDADVDADVDVAGDVDTDLDAGIDHAHVADAHAAAPNMIAQFFGLGRIPLSISLMVTCYTIGIAGWIANQLLAPRLGSPATFFPLTVLISLVCALCVLRLVGGFMARYAPAFSTSAIDPRRLVGATAQAVLPVSERIGLAALHDKFGTLHTVQCRVASGVPPISKGQKVVLVKYLPDRQMFLVGRA